MSPRQSAPKVDKSYQALGSKESPWTRILCIFIELKCFPLVQLLAGKLLMVYIIHLIEINRDTDTLDRVPLTVAASEAEFPF